MRILITTDWYNSAINGVVVSVNNLYKELVKKGHDVRIVTLSEDGIAKKEKDVYYLKSREIKIYPQARATSVFENEFMEELVEWAPEVIHSQYEFMTFSYAKRLSKKLNIPIIHTYHTIYEDYTHYFMSNEALARKAVRIWTRLLIRNMSTVIVPTDKVKELLESYKISTPTEVIPSGIDLEQFRTEVSEEEKLEIRKKFGIAKESTLLVSIGRLAKEKRIEELIEFVKNKREDGKDIMLLIVGSGPYEAVLKGMVKRQQLEDCIKFTGMIHGSEIHKYYHTGDVYINASTSETQGLTYVEALACGIPVVCRKDSCVNNLVIDGFSGYMYESYEDFSRQIDMLTEDRAGYQLIAAQAKQMAERYSAQRFSDNVERVYVKNCTMHNSRRLVTFLKKRFV